MARIDDDILKFIKEYPASSSVEIHKAAEKVLLQQQKGQ